MSPDDEAAGCTRKLGVDEMKALLVRGQASEGLTRCGREREFNSFGVRERTDGDAPAMSRRQDLWLVWYQLEPSWNSWRALQSVSGRSRG